MIPSARSYTFLNSSLRVIDLLVPRPHGDQIGVAGHSLCGKRNLVRSLAHAFSLLIFTLLAIALVNCRMARLGAILQLLRTLFLQVIDLLAPYPHGGQIGIVGHSLCGKRNLVRSLADAFSRHNDGEWLSR